MRVSIHTLGTRGDVQPFVSLALQLRSRGHDVQIAAPAQFDAFVRGHGIGFAPMPSEFLDLLNTPEASDAIGKGKGFSAGFKLLKKVRPMMRRLMDEELAADRAFAPNVTLYHPKAFAAPHIAEVAGIPAILASPLPGFTPTAAFPTPLLPVSNLGPLNRASHALATRSTDMMFGRDIRKWREESMGAPPRRRSPAPDGTLYAYSPSVIPVPADYGPEVLVSGYWFLDDQDWTPPPTLREFLENGSAPIYVGFGSMPGIEPASLTRVFVEGVKLAGLRAVLATGGGALGPNVSDPSVYFLDHAPHDRLFPRMRAIVHHGGAGTTAAALRAGKAMAIMPFFGDQPFWARRMRALGVAPAQIDRKRLTPESIATTLTAMTAPNLTRRAEAIAQQIASEDGTTLAAAFIEAAVAKFAGNKREAARL